jgi:integrase
VRVYKRKTPSGYTAFMVANYADGETRRFDSYKDEGAALEAAEALAKRLDSRNFIAASMTKEQGIDFANAVEQLKPFGLAISEAVTVLTQCLREIGTVSNLHEAVKLYKDRRKVVTKKPVPEVVAELLTTKENRKASRLYLKDLRGRLERSFARDCKKDACNVTTADLQAWLDSQKLAPQSYKNYRTVLHTFFSFAVAKGYAADNPADGVERIKLRDQDVEVFKPAEIARLLEAARKFPDFLPCLAIGAFAGLRSAEIERLEWSDIDLKARHIVVSAGKAKTASRRIVPISANLAAWLADYARQEGKLWTQSSNIFYQRQKAIARATAVEADEANGIKAQKPIVWKSNALRHSYASYRFAQTSDAGRVAGELGNSAAVIFRHYNKLVTPAEAEEWFKVRPELPRNVLAFIRVQV